MKRKTKYRKIKKLREWRDDAFRSDNYGRTKQLIFDHPQVQKISINHGGFRITDCDVRLHDGTEFYCRESIFIEKTLDKMIEKLYKYFAEQLLTT